MAEPERQRFEDIERRIIELARALERRQQGLAEDSPELDFGPQEQARRRRNSLLQRLAAVGLGRREEEPEDADAAPRAARASEEELRETLEAVVRALRAMGYRLGPPRAAPAQTPDQPPGAIRVEGPTMSNGDDLTDAKIARSAAETETKIARLEGKIDTMNATLVGEMRGLRDEIHKADQYNRDSRWVLFTTFVVGMLALAGLVIGLATYGDAMFGRGMNIRDIVKAVIVEQNELQKREQPPTKGP